MTEHPFSLSRYLLAVVVGGVAGAGVVALFGGGGFVMQALELMAVLAVVLWLVGRPSTGGGKRQE